MYTFSSKVLRPYLESSMDVEILEKFIGIIDENRPILSILCRIDMIGVDSDAFRYICFWYLSWIWSTSRSRSNQNCTYRVSETRRMDWLDYVFYSTSRLVDVLVDAINKGETTTMGKWAMRALVPIVGSNEQQLEQIITHSLFGKVSKMFGFRSLGRFWWYEKMKIRYFRTD